MCINVITYFFFLKFRRISCNVNTIDIYIYIYTYGKHLSKTFFCSVLNTYCSMVVANCDDVQDCSDHGDCIAPDVCSCHKGWGGDRCFLSKW